MVSLKTLQTALDSGQWREQEYQAQSNLNLYDSPSCDRLSTQAAAGRQFRLSPDGIAPSQAFAIQLCEDDYPGWLLLEDLDWVEVAETKYRFQPRSQAEIQSQIPAVIAFTLAAMKQPNSYLWGGTVGPNYDCSGLMQTAFASVGFWLPRDAYQQEAFTQAIPLSDLQPGDLVFFGSPAKATHVGLYLGEGQYIHSSGKDQGRNGIGIDLLSEQGDTVSQTYFRQLRGAGRVVASYEPAPAPV